jgi:hypothetical protein
MGKQKVELKQRHDWTRQGRHLKKRKDKPRQDETRQDKTKQDNKTKQNKRTLMIRKNEKKTRQDITCLVLSCLV